MAEERETKPQKVPKIQVIIRDVDTDIKEHFEKIKPGDWATEARRLLSKAIESE
ncbi:hypothetical protein TCA2_4512 [Paenibacillus sp. TCA20]|uniref:hypothetical protein n=1 Tax=Paenibacillus sp. TCA20 TaxID=1499968 RepID=UPI0004D753C2|nr:hypothetical protein [Paenibacillus sp. TCA20]GAK42020.1 hypothetical protein TCA2_4512 [Paenibacillus sp. TCA20]